MVDRKNQCRKDTLGESNALPVTWRWIRGWIRRRPIWDET